MRRLICLAFVWVIALSASARAENAGVVSAATPEAAAAGVEILEAGGNAIDAAVAVQFALGVTESAMSGLGGQSQIIVHPPQGEPFVINGTSYAPEGVDLDATAEALRVGHTASTVPSTVKVMDFAWRRYGSGEVEWAQLLAPAERYAREGYVVGPFRAKVFARHEADLRADPTAASLFLTEEGFAPREGDLVRQPLLAQTLARLAEAGAEDFYTGEIAAAIARDMAANGGWITEADLASVPEPRVAEPLKTRYRGYDVYTLPPPAGGWVVLQALNLLEAAPQETLAAEDDARAAALLKALRLVHRTRADDPVEDLIDYGDDVSIKISKDEAARILAAAAQKDRGETTHFTVVDKDGMVVSVTASVDSYFGAKRASPELGFLYNNYMQAFELGEPEHPFALRPGGMPYSSMSATILAKDGAPALGLGSPGSARIISAVTQVASHWIDVGSGIEAAVAAPRVHAVPGEASDAVYVESPRLGAALIDALAAMDADLVRPRSDLEIKGLNAYYGGVHAVAIEEGGWRGAADPRRDGAVGYEDRRSR